MLFRSMVIKDDQVIVSAKKIGTDEDGTPIPEMLPTEEVYAKQPIGYFDWSIEHINKGLNQIHPGLTADNLYDLESMFGDNADSYREKIDEYFDREGVQSLTRLMLYRENWKDWYKELDSDGDRSIYRVIGEPFVTDEMVMERTCEGVLPYIKGRNEEQQKYTVVIWLEGDDPQCTNELMNGFIGLNFQIKHPDEEYVAVIVTPSDNPQTELQGI